MMKNEELYGRVLVWPKVKAVPDHYQKQLSFIKYTCQRCGQKKHLSLPNRQFYCEGCLLLGRVSSLDYLVSLPEPNNFDGQVAATWSGVLTVQQKGVSRQLLNSWLSYSEHLVWAATGAGKTEMLFPLLLAAFQAKQRVAIVSPRLDVITELAPRIAAAFGNLSQIVLHGQQSEQYCYSQLVLATTHQLLRFQEAFDLMVVDEVDSFPYQGDAMLNYAVAKAGKKEHATIYLTATPTSKMRKAIKRGQLKVSYLPMRFHQQLLPNIQVVRVSQWRRKIPMRLKNN